MKYALLILVSLSVQSVIAQCKTCLSIEDAMKVPEEVVILDLSAKKLLELPKGLNKFINLERLYLSDNFLNQIDFQKLELPKLIELNLANNPGFNALNMEGIDKAMPKLKELNMSNSSIQYVSPDVAKLNALNSLNLSDNSLKEIPQEIEEMLSLRNLSLSNNKIEANPMLFSQLWNVERLDLSGNDGLRLYQIGAALDFKSLKSLSISSSVKKGALPKTFKELQVETLRITDSEIESFNGSVTANPFIKKIIFDNCDFTDQSKIISWLARFDSLEVVEFNDMTIKTGIDKLNNFDEVRFDRCAINVPSELQELSGLRVVATNCGLEDVEEEEGALATLQDDPLMLSESMKNNEVSTIIDVQPERINVNPAKEIKVELDNSTYYIPPSAFKTANGDVYTGEVNLEIKEYFDPVTSALAGLPMMYESEEESGVFSSSGMIDFRAHDDKGNELQPNLDSPIQVEFNDVQPSENSKLYVYRDSLKNWEILNSPESTDYDEIKRNLIDSLNQVADKEMVYTRRVPIIMRMKYKKRKYDPTTLDFSYSSVSLRKTANLSRAKHYLKNSDEKFLSKMSWKIDTVLSPELFSTLKEMKRDQKKADRRHTGFFAFRRYNYDTRPRLIVDMKVEPDVERDNYRLSFMYKAEKIEIPVYPVMKGSPQRIQGKERGSFKMYNRKLKVTNKELAKIEREEQRYIKKEAEKIRARQIKAIERDPIIGAPRREKLFFALSLFGLLNCDFIPRRPAPTFFRLTPKGVDQNDAIVDIPMEIRNIGLGDNSYTTTNNRLVPALTSSQVKSFFPIDETEIGVIKDWNRAKGGKIQGDIYRFSIEGKTEEQVKSIILSL